MRFLLINLGLLSAAGGIFYWSAFRGDEKPPADPALASGGSALSAADRPLAKAAGSTVRFKSTSYTAAGDAKRRWNRGIDSSGKSDASNSSHSAETGPSPQEGRFLETGSSSVTQPISAEADPVTVLGAGNRFTQAEIDALEAGVVEILGAFETAWGAQVLGETFPLVGDNFVESWQNNQASFRFLDAVRTQSATALATFIGAPDYDPAAVATAVRSRLVNQGGFPSGSTTVTSTTVGDGAQLTFSIARTYPQAPVSIAADLGLPNLDLQVSGAPVAQTVVAPVISFTIGVDGDGFYLRTSDAAWSVAMTATIATLDVPGTFAGMPYRFTRNASDATSIPLQFALVMKEPSGNGLLHLSELGGNPDLLDVAVSGNTRTTLKIDSLIPATAMAPRAGSDLVIRWDFQNAAVRPDDDNATFGGKPAFLLENNRVNLDSFFISFADRTLRQIRSSTEPFRGVIDVLTEPIPLLSDLGSDEVTFLDILGAEPGAVAAIGGLDGILDLANLAASFSVNATTSVDLGSFSLEAGDPRVETLDEMPGFAVRGPSATRPEQLNTFLSGVADVQGLGFPLLDDPSVVANLMLGRDATLFSYRSPEAEFSTSFQQFYPVLGPLGVTLGGELALETQFGFGYDTRGFMDYVDGGANDAGLLTNGFYAMALDESGNPLTGIMLSAGVTAGIELNVALASVGVEGDLTATIGIYLDDLIGDEQGRIRGDVFASRPLDEWFYAAGSLSAGLHAYLEVGWPPFGVSFDFESPRVTLISFDSRDQTTPVLAAPDLTNPGDLILNVGERAPLRLHGDTDDRAEEFRVSLDGTDLLVEAFNRENDFPLPTRVVGHGNLRGDKLELAADLAVPAFFTGGDGRDVLRGGAADDVLEGGEGPDLLNGRADDDTLRGGGDNDELIAGDGNDTFEGGDGLDTASWNGASVPLILDLRNGTFDGAATGDTLVSIERYEGTSHDDTMDGSEGNDSLLDGSDGNDAIHGHGGADQLQGGTGDDLLGGGEGDDLLAGGAGADTLDGGAGTDIASYLGAESPVSASLLTGTGTRGDALGDAFANIEILMGSGLPKEPGPGSLSGDILEGDDLANTVYGMDGSDTLRGHGGNDILWGNHPDIPGMFRPGFDDDSLFGGAGDDTLNGQIGDDSLDGGDGVDLLFGDAGDDHLTTGDTAAADALDGGDGYDRLSADYSEKADPFEFEVGIEQAFEFADGDRFTSIETLGTLKTGGDNDRIRLSPQVEPILWPKNIDAGPGDDLIYTDSRGFYPTSGSPVRSNDSLHGGDGNDTLSFEQSIAGVTVDLTTGAATGITFTGFENLIGTDMVDSLTGDAADNVLMPLMVPPGAGTDQVNGQQGNDTLRIDYSGNAEANLYGIQMYIESFPLSGEQHLINLRTTPVRTISNPYQIERYEIIGGNADDLFFGSPDQGFVPYSAYNDRFEGRGGNDAFTARRGNDHVDGGDGDDVIDPGWGNDTAIGGPGNDTITFGYGVTMDGGPAAYGHDIAEGGPGDDTIINFSGDLNTTPGGNQTFTTATTVMQIDGGPGTDTLTADLGNLTDDLYFDEASPTDFELPNGGYIRSIERFSGVTTGIGNDVIRLRGRGNNRIGLYQGDDIIHPGLGIDRIHGGSGNNLLILDFSEGDEPDASGITGSGGSLSATFARTHTGTGALLDECRTNSFNRLHFTGTSKADICPGMAGNDWIHGGGGDDTLSGNLGNDRLDGGTGVDLLRGEGGDDTYLIDHPDDRAEETSSSNGTDTVISSVSYILGPYVDRLILAGTAISGTGSSQGNILTGNRQNNILRGEGSADTLDGGGGPLEIDRLHGGTSADTFVLGSQGIRYYDDRQSGTPGLTGYAIIEDFTPSQSDRLRLAGPVAEYLSGVSPFAETPGTALYHDSDGSGTLDPAADELIAILQSAVELTSADILGNALISPAVNPASIGLTSPLLPVRTNSPVGERFGMRFTLADTIPSNVRLEIQTSSDLGGDDPWITLATKSGNGSWTGLVPVTSTSAAGRTTYEIQSPDAISSRPRHFMRLRLSQ